MVVVRIGRLDRKITLRQRTVTRGDAGGQIEGYSDVATIYAEKLDVAGREYFAAQQVNSEITTKFRIRFREDIRPTWRIRFEGKDYNIASIAEIGGRRRWLEIMASAIITEELDFEA